MRPSPLPVAALLLLAGAAAGVQPQGLLFRDDVEGDAAYGIRVEASEYLVELVAHGNAGVAMDVIAVFEYNAQQQFMGGFVWSWNSWAPRNVVTLGYAGLDAFEERVGLRTHATDASCPYACVTLYGSPWTGPYWVLWDGGMSRTTTEVWGPDGAKAHVGRGTPHALSDAMLTDGSPNVQAGLLLPSPAGPSRPAGAKALRDAVVEVQVEHRLHGLFYALDGKRACTLLTACAAGDEVEGFCGQVTGIDCRSVAISWAGPAGGGSGNWAYPLIDEPPGAYKFRIDRALDAWGGWLWHPGSSTYLDLFEDHVNLALADAPFP